MFYGAADFCGGLATKRTALLAVAIISQASGFVLLLAMLPFFPGHPSVSDYEFGALAGVCGGVGLALLYHALSIGKMGVVSPITAILSASVPVAISVARHDAVRPLQLFGILIALAAVVLISMSFEESGEREVSTRGVKEAIASGLVLGGFLYFLSDIHPAAGLHALITMRIASVLFLLAVALAMRVPLKPAEGAWPLILFGGAIDMTANALFLLAVFAGNLAIAAVLTALYPASTVFLARIVLKERLQLVQKIGVGLALIGVALIAAK